MSTSLNPSEVPSGPAGDRLDSWKEIAAYFRRGERTVRRWEQTEGLPVHRHAHLKRGSVYAYKSELDGWWMSRKDRLEREEHLPSRRPVSTRQWLVTGGVLSLALAVGGVALWRSGAMRRDSAAPLKSTPVTSYIGLEIFPSLSPDGSQVAFSWNGERPDNFDVYVQPISGGKPSRLTFDPGDDTSPAWSPDGRTLAFLRFLSNGNAAVVLIPAEGGTERKLAETRPPGWRFWSYGSHLAWSPDGKWLAFEDRHPPGNPSALFLISLETGERRRLTSPPQDSMGDASPALAPNGRGLAFIRTVNDSELYFVPLAGGLRPSGEPQQLTSYHQITTSPVWTPDGRSVLFVSGERWAPYTLWRMPVFDRVGDGRPRFGSPERVASIDERADVLTLSKTGPGGAPRLIYNRGVFDPNVWRIELSDTGAKSAPLISSTRVENSPEFSPDGKRIAFQSSRSGSSEIWTCDSDGSNAVQLTSRVGAKTGAPRWSPDGKRLVFESSVQGKSHVYVISANGGTPRRLTQEAAEERNASWSRDGRWIYFHSNRGGRSQVWKMPVEGGEPVQVTRTGGSVALESPDGRFVYYSRGGSLWRVPVAEGPASREDRVLESMSFGTFALVDRGIYFIRKSHPTGGGAIHFLSFAGGKPREVFATDKPIVVGLSASPDGRTILYTQVDREDSDLMLLENFR